MMLRPSASLRASGTLNQLILAWLNNPYDISRISPSEDGTTDLETSAPISVAFSYGPGRRHRGKLDAYDTRSMRQNGLEEASRDRGPEYPDGVRDILPSQRLEWIFVDLRPGVRPPRHETMYGELRRPEFSWSVVLANCGSSGVWKGASTLDTKRT
ncbi:hypothetical protein BGW80DRAFT_1248933 [Lactifluus volemus]|nr:hypothetical protein BGW80DRAFT_1248933 [Lactifluus volemus]